MGQGRERASPGDSITWGKGGKGYPHILNRAAWRGATDSKSVPNSVGRSVPSLRGRREAMATRDSISFWRDSISNLVSIPVPFLLYSLYSILNIILYWSRYENTFTVCHFIPSFLSPHKAIRWLDISSVGMELALHDRKRMMKEEWQWPIEIDLSRIFHLHSYEGTSRAQRAQSTHPVEKLHYCHIICMIYGWKFGSIVVKLTEEGTRIGRCLLMEAIVLIEGAIMWFTLSRIAPFESFTDVLQ